jgi:TolB-like protein/tetratricopeptide (TPR) repeat protein
MTDRSELAFGRFRLDLSQRQLALDGVPIPLGNRALDILCVLAAANGEIVSKDQLMSHVWPGLVVDENTIRVHISALRKALDEGKSDQTYLITVPGRGYRLVGLKPQSLAVDRGEGGSSDSAPSDKPSIAVLPFQNMSGDPEQDYFADGMVDEIITGLSRIKWLSVISRNSSFIYKNQPVAIKEIAERLGVRYVLEGGVRKSGNRVRITAQLIDTQTDAHLWAEQYDRVLDDVFALQDEITMCVIGAIEPSLTKAEIGRVKRKRPDNLSAYDLVLRVLPSFFGQMARDAATAIPLLEKAIELQPDYGAAHAFLGWFLHRRFVLERHETDRVAAIRHARATIACGNDDATALAVAAHVIAYDDHDTTTALKLFDRALEISNSNVLALSLSAIALAWMGEAEISIERAQRAIQLNPFDSYNFRSSYALAVSYFYERQYENAVDAAQNAVDYNPHFCAARAVLAAALLRVGRAAEAKAAARDALECEPNFTIHGWALLVQLEPEVYRPFADAWREVGLPE